MKRPLAPDFLRYDAKFPYVASARQFLAMPEIDLPLALAFLRRTDNARLFDVVGWMFAFRAESNQDGDTSAMHAASTYGDVIKGWAEEEKRATDPQQKRLFAALQAIGLKDLQSVTEGDFAAFPGKTDATFFTFTHQNPFHEIAARQKEAEQRAFALVPEGMGKALSILRRVQPMLALDVESDPRDTDAKARGIVLEAWSRVVSEPPTLAQLQFVQAVARFESNYGLGWKPAGAIVHGITVPPPGGVGSNNWGAVTAEPAWQGARFQYPDTLDGKKETARLVWFKAFPTPADGAANTLRELYRRRETWAAIEATKDLFSVAEAMKASAYFGVTAQAYAKALAPNVAAIAKALNEPQAIALRGGPLPYPGGGSGTGPGSGSSRPETDQENDSAMVAALGVLVVGTIAYAASKGKR